MAALRGARSFDLGRGLGAGAAAAAAADVDVAVAACDVGSAGVCVCVCLGVVSFASGSDVGVKMGCDCCASSSRIDGMCESVLGGLVSWTRGIGGSIVWVMEVSGPPALRGGEGGCGLRR